jgi:hypothetical protein
VVEALDDERYLYTRRCFDRDLLVGAITIGHPRHVGAVRGLIQTRLASRKWKGELMKNPTRVMEAFVDLTRA